MSPLNTHTPPTPQSPPAESSSPASADVWRDLVAASKKKKGPLYTRYVNRNAAIPLTYAFWKLGLHPNAVSVISFLATHTALLLLVLLGGEGLLLAVAALAWFLLALGYVMDSCDGQLARVSGKTSPLGEWLDHSLDMVKILNINMALAYLMIAHAVASEQPLLIPLLAAFLNLLSQPAHFFVINMKDKLLSKGGKEPESAQGRLRPVIHIADYGLFILIVLLLPWQEAFVPVYLGYGVLFMMIFTAHFARTSLMIVRMKQ